MIAIAANTMQHSPQNAAMQHAIAPIIFILFIRYLQQDRVLLCTNFIQKRK
jgi:hypothetical protein